MHSSLKIYFRTTDNTLKIEERRFFRNSSKLWSQLIRFSHFSTFVELSASGLTQTAPSADEAQRSLGGVYSQAWLTKLHNSTDLSHRPHWCGPASM